MIKACSGHDHPLPTIQTFRWHLKRLYMHRAHSHIGQMCDLPEDTAHAVLTGKLMEPCIPSHILSKHGCGRISELPLTTWKCITVPGHKQNKGEGPLFKTYLLLASQTSAILEKRWWLSVLVIVVPSSLEFLNIRIRISRLSKYECSEDITSNIACMWEGGGDTHTHTHRSLLLALGCENPGSKPSWSNEVHRMVMSRILWPGWDI